MKLTVTRTDVWAAPIKDRPGGLEDKLAPLAEAGANIEFVVARRDPKKPGKGVVFLTPLMGAKLLRAARKAGFKKATGMHSVRVEGPDRPGLGWTITRRLAEADINLRGLSAATIGRKFVLYLSLDSSADANRAIRALKSL